MNQPGYRPLPPGKRPEQEPPIRVKVDGETFDVSKELGRPGQYHFDWVSGPNPSYGFAVGTSGGREMNRAEIEDTIRDWLARVDPETGYIE
ncbi:MAG TPA: hypothetical protein VFK41_13120 [Nocardioidaceae bacterium]|nr:hypothetical protein [Nocardioidaceae bacterium]